MNVSSLQYFCCSSRHLKLSRIYGCHWKRLITERAPPIEHTILCSTQLYKLSTMLQIQIIHHQQDQFIIRTFQISLIPVRILSIICLIPFFFRCVSFPFVSRLLGLLYVWEI